MEEIKISMPASHKLFCENDSCNKPTNYYCFDHDQILCNSCFTALHVRCICDEIPDQEDIKECLSVVKSLFKSVHENSEEFRAGSYIKCFNEEFKNFNEKLAVIDEKFANATEHKKIYEFCEIRKEVLQLQKAFIESNSFSEFSKLKELKLVAAGGSLSRQVKENQQRNSYWIKLKDYRKQVFKQMEENNRNKAKQIAEQLSRDIVNQCKQTINELEDKIKEDQQLNKMLEDKNIQITKEFKEQTEELEAQKQKITNMITEEKRKQKEKEKYEYEQNQQFSKFNKFYEKNIGLKISYNPYSNLQISLKDSKQKSLMESCVTSRFKLPDFNGVRIDYISDADADLVSFFRNCIPARLKLLAINCYANNFAGINSKYYVKAFSKAASRTATEVYFKCIDFSAEDLQTVIRAAHNAERIVFDFCCIHLSSDLDFGADLSFKTKFLSFQHCGNTFYKERTSDWKADPSKFSLIVDAISSSGLRDSLEKISIFSNQTLSASEVQEELYEKGVSQVSVVDEYCDPLLS